MSASLDLRVKSKTNNRVLTRSNDNTICQNATLLHTNWDPMRADYTRWLTEQQYADNTKAAQLHRVKKVEESYGNLDEHFANGTYDGVINALKYSRADEKANKPNPSKIKFDGNIRNNLQSYKNAVVRYRKFLNDIGFQKAPIPQQDLREKK